MGLLLLFALACGGKDAVAPEPEMRPEDALVGTWETQGVDEALGPVRVRMRLDADGGLAMTLFMENGGQRSFPGAWQLLDDVLILRGVYFTPDNESRVNWRLQEDGALLLRDVGGVEQEWLRVE